MGDDLLVFGQFGEPVFELGERQRKRPLDMTSAVFLRRAHAQHHDLAVARTRASSSSWSTGSSASRSAKKSAAIWSISANHRSPKSCNMR